MKWLKLGPHMLVPSFADEPRLLAEEPLELTKEMMIKPTAAQWKNANKLFGHPHRCRCSTCQLAADLAVMIARHDERTAQ